jgi:hypothetical protein
MGIYPASFTDIFGPTVENLIKNHQMAMETLSRLNVAAAGVTP